MNLSASSARRLRQLSPRYALAAGRGSSDAAALLAKYLLEARLGLPTVSVAPSVHSIYGRKLDLEKALLLAISQSGRSPDLVEFCRAATGPDVLRVGLINDAASPLAAAVDVCVPLQAGPERSVAATKSCLAAMTLVLGLVAHWRNDAAMIAAFERAPHVLSGALDQDWSAAEAFLDGDGPVYVVGRGPGLAIAAEAALKLKETNGLHAEAVSAAEIRHGPLRACRSGPSHHRLRPARRRLRRPEAARHRSPATRLPAALHLCGVELGNSRETGCRACARTPRHAAALLPLRQRLRDPARPLARQPAHAHQSHGDPLIMQALSPTRLFTGDEIVEGATVHIDSGRIANVSTTPSPGARKLDGLLAPGFIDVQVNGGGGALFNDAPTVDTLATIAAAHRQFRRHRLHGDAHLRRSGQGSQSHGRRSTRP